MPEKIFVSHLIKQRHAPANVGFSSHSGKLSALSQRKVGAPQKQQKPGKRDTVVFGPPTYLEHSGNEMSSDEEYDEDDAEMEDGEEYDEESEEEEDQQMEAADSSGGSAAANTDSAAVGGVKGALDHMEPDDGMDWDSAETEKVQREQEAKRVEKQQQDQRQYHQQQQQQHQQQQQQLQHQQQEADARAREQARAAQEQSQIQAQQQNLQNQQQRQQATGFGAPSSDSSRLSSSSPVGPQGRSSSPMMQAQNQSSSQQPNGLQRPPHLRNASSDRSSSSASSLGLEGNSPSAGSSFMPSQVQAQRDRSTSDASTASQQQPFGRASPSPDSKSKDQRRQSARKSKGEDDLSGTGEEKSGGKKRSSVFSGLFSRKDKKDRKSGSFGGSTDGDSVVGRSSDDSFVREKSKGRTSPAVGQSSGAGKNVQERDRAQQQAYQQQFLSGNRSNAGSVSMDPDLSQQSSFSTRAGGRPARPGSLIGTPGSVPMLNVLRVFAGDDIDSDATFKTVLLNEGTTSVDLVRQAIQRFRLGSDHTPDQYVLTIRLLDGDERILSPFETPLQVMDALTETHPDQDVPSMLSVKRSSVGSISSISSNLSTHPAIARLGNDFSDDHAVKFYLNLKSSRVPQRTPGSEDAASWLQVDNGTGDTTSSFESQQASHLSMLSADSADTMQNAQTARFTMRVLIFPSDLPEGLVFDPQTNALIPSETLAKRGPSGSAPGEGVHQGYREKLLAFPKNATVAEVIETGLDRFGIEDGVVEGGDDVEERTSRRRSRPRVKYGLSVDINRHERGLPPTSRVLEAYPSPPLFKSSNRRSMDGRRRSADSSMLLGMVDDVRPEDPVFILRQVKDRAVRTKSARALSPTQDVLVSKEEQRRQAELATVSSAPLESAGNSGTEGMSRQEIVAAQRAAVLGAQRNEEEGIDVVLTDKARIRSSRSLEGQVRYSYLPQAGGKEQDISSIIEEVFRDQEAGLGPNSKSSESNLLAPDSRPSLRAARSDLTLDSYESAPSTPRGTSPLSLNEVHFDTKSPPPQLPSLGSSLGGLGSLDNLSTSTTAPLSMGSKSRQAPRSNESNDLLETFVRNPNASDKTIDERIDQVLSRVNGTSSSQSRSSSRGVISPSGSGSGRGTPIANAHSRGINGASPYGENGSRSMTSPASHRKQISNGSELSNSMETPSPFGNASSSTTHATSATLPLGAGGAMLAGSGAGAAAYGYSSYFNRPGSSASVSLNDADQGLDHLYALTEFAAKKPRSKSSMNSYGKVRISAQEILNQDKEEREERSKLRPDCAGLFGPSLSFIEHSKTREAYRHVGKQMEDMDQVS